MNIFQKMKERVTARQVAERYGLKVSRNGMARCPFHNDKHPSMKIDQNYYCFSCGAKGDAVNYVAALFGLSQLEAAKKINEDFTLGILIGKPEAKRKQNSRVNKKEKVPTKEERVRFVRKKIDKWVKDATNVLLRYLRWIEFWKKFYKPESVEEEWHGSKSMGCTGTRTGENVSENSSEFPECRETGNAEKQRSEKEYS